MVNDEMFLEFSRALAFDVVASHKSDSDRMIEIVRRLTTRPPGSEELEWLLEYQQAQLSRLKNGELKASEILDAKEGSAELASWVMLARAVMNLDETVTK